MLCKTVVQNDMHTHISSSYSYMLVLGLVFWRPFLKPFTLCYRSVVCLSCGSCPVLSVTFVHCGQTVGRIKMKLGMQVGLGPGHIVLDRNPAPHPPKGHSPTKFSAHICCGQMAAWIKMPVGMELGLSPGDFVLDGDPAPLNFRPMFISYCDFVTTLHKRKALLVCSSSSSSSLFYAFHFYKV